MRTSESSEVDACGAMQTNGQTNGRTNDCLEADWFGERRCLVYGGGGAYRLDDLVGLSHVCVSVCLSLNLFPSLTTRLEKW